MAVVWCVYHIKYCIWANGRKKQTSHKEKLIRFCSFCHTIKALPLKSRGREKKTLQTRKRELLKNWRGPCEITARKIDPNEYNGQIKGIEFNEMATYPRFCYRSIETVKVFPQSAFAVHICCGKLQEIQIFFQVSRFGYWEKKVVDFHWRNFATIKLIQPKRSILTNWIQSIFFTKYRGIRSRGIIVPPEVGNRFFNYPSHLKYIHINASEWYSSCYNLERRRMNGRQRWIDMIKYARCFFCMKSIHLHRRPDRTETNALTRDGRRPLSPDWTFHNNVA